MPGRPDAGRFQLGLDAPRQRKAHDQQYGREQHHADHLDDNGRIGDFRPHRIARPHDVRHFVQRGAGVKPHLFGREVEDTGPVQSRIDEHRQRAENDDGGYRHGRLVRFALDDRFGPQHGRRPANRAPRGRQQREVAVHLQQPSDEQTQKDRGRHDDADYQQSGQADGDHALEREPEAVQDDAGAQDLLGAELYAGYPGGGQTVAQTVGVQHTEYDADNERTE